MAVGPSGLCVEEQAVAPAEAPSRLALKEFSDSDCTVRILLLS